MWVFNYNFNCSDRELPRFLTLEIISFTSSLSQYTTMAPEKDRPSEGGVGCIFFLTLIIDIVLAVLLCKDKKHFKGALIGLIVINVMAFTMMPTIAYNGGKHWKEVQLSKTELARLSTAERGLARNNLEMGPVSDSDEVPQLVSVEPPLYSRTGAIGNEPGNPPSYFESHSSIPDPPVFPPGPFMPHTENQR